MSYSIVLYDETKHYKDLEKFCQQAALDDIENNEMKFPWWSAGGE